MAYAGDSVRAGLPPAGRAFLNNRKKLREISRVRKILEDLKKKKKSCFLEVLPNGDSCGYP